MSSLREHCNIAVLTLFSIQRSHLIQTPCWSFCNAQGHNGYRSGQYEGNNGSGYTKYFSPGNAPLSFCSSLCTLHLVEFLDEFDVVSHDVPDLSFGALDEDELSIATLRVGLSLLMQKTQLGSHLRVWWHSLSIMQSLQP